MAEGTGSTRLIVVVVVVVVVRRGERIQGKRTKRIHIVIDRVKTAVWPASKARKRYNYRNITTRISEVKKKKINEYKYEPVTLRTGVL